MPSDAIISWNVRGNHESWASREKTVQRVLDAMAQGGAVVIALQEVPGGAIGPRGWRHTWHKKRAVATSFDPVKWASIAEIEIPYALGVTLRNVRTGITIRFWNVHLQSEQSGDARAREAQARKTIVQQLQEARQRSPLPYEVILGDFNFDPHDDLLVGNDGFRANGHAPWVRQQKKKAAPADVPMFNPSWRIYGGHCGAPGTYYRRADRSGRGPWLVRDQILVAPELVDDARSTPVVISSIGGVELAKQDGCPDSALVSDHLPIGLNLDVSASATG